VQFLKLFTTPFSGHSKISVWGRVNLDNAFYWKPGPELEYAGHYNEGGHFSCRRYPGGGFLPCSSGADSGVKEECYD